MKIEVIANGRGSITIKSDGEYSNRELMALARGAAKLTEKLIAAQGGAKKPFGFEAGTHPEDCSLGPDWVDARALGVGVPKDVPPEVPGYLPHYPESARR